MSSYSLADLCDLADVTPRTVRYYIAQGLLRPPGGGGPAARYDDGHLYRLRLIRQLQREHLPLAEIRPRLAALSDHEVEGLVVAAPPVTDTAAEYVARVLGSKGVRVVGKPGGPVLPRGAMEMRRPLAGLPVDGMSDALRPASGAAPASAASPFVDEGSGLAHASAGPALASRSQWERVSLTPDLELHIRRPLSRDQNRRVDRLIEAARSILEEDQP